MRFPRWYARWNRLATNRLVRLWAGWVPAMGLLSHLGRKSGRLYRTPLNVFPTADGVAIFLPYGTETTEWLKNVQAAGGAPSCSATAGHFVSANRGWCLNPSLKVSLRRGGARSMH